MTAACLCPIANSQITSQSAPRRKYRAFVHSELSVSFLQASWPVVSLSNLDSLFLFFLYFPSRRWLFRCLQIRLFCGVPTLRALQSSQTLSCHCPGHHNSAHQTIPQHPPPTQQTTKTITRRQQRGEWNSAILVPVLWAVCLETVCVWTESGSV